MRELFQQLADSIALGMEVVACGIVTAGAVAALLKLARWAFQRTSLTRKDIWRHFALSLLVGLEFMLAADIVRSAISPTMQQIAQLAAIAGIRTFLNFFLEKDIEHASPREQREYAEPTRLGSAA